MDTAAIVDPSRVATRGIDDRLTVQVSYPQV
jgi:hypothetical protein